MPDPAPLLDLTDISLYFGAGKAEVCAVDRVSLDVKEGEFAVIVGPSGCGKSSLLYLAAGLQTPSSGTITLAGKAALGPSAERGMVFQSYTLFPWLKVRDNIAFGLKQRNVPVLQRKAIVDHYLKEVGLEKFADRYPSELSGGMKQRVAIARAMANSPKILLMDEPFGALDSQTRLNMQKLLLRVWEHDKTTVLFVTHDIDEAILLADRIFVMSPHPGRIREVLSVPLARPRSLKMAMDERFIALKQKLFELLHSGEEDDA